MQIWLGNDVIYVWGLRHTDWRTADLNTQKPNNILHLQLVKGKGKVFPLQARFGPEGG